MVGHDLVDAPIQQNLQELLVDRQIVVAVFGTVDGIRRQVRVDTVVARFWYTAATFLKGLK
jgi:hypothetical protein